jgi:hypothetical protein
MKIVGCDLHAIQQSIAMSDTETGEFTEKTIRHETTGPAARDPKVTWRRAEIRPTFNGEPSSGPTCPFFQGD